MMSKKLALVVMGLLASGAASAACDVTLEHTLSNSQVLLQAKCIGGPITGINWLRNGVSIESTMLSPAVPDGSPVFATIPVPSGTYQYTATGATGGNPATTVDVVAGLAVTIVTSQPVLTVAPTDGGTVSSTPAGITACASNSVGDECTGPFDSGTTVTLTAAATTGFAFSGWSGDCTGSATVCAVNMSGPKTVSANFGPQPTNGACGSDSSSTPVASPPSGVNLCSEGTPTAVADPGTSAAGSYTWTCNGVNGGAASSQCSVPKLLDGVCGTANGTTGLEAAPTGTAACNPGTTQGMTAATQAPFNFTWTCAGYNSGATSAGCSAEMAATAGTCGTANGTNVAATPTGTAACGTGTVSGMNTPAAGGDYTWTCAGLAGGATSGTCTAHQTVNGACGSANGVAVSSAPSANLCVIGSVATSVSGTGPWTWGCNGVNGGTSTSATACSAPVQAVGACGTTPPAYLVVEPNTSAYGGTWRPDSSSATYVAQLPVGAGVALKFTANPSVYIAGFKITDSTGGSKSYVVSRCPGSSTPVDNQDGTISVNGDTRNDNCKVNNGYARWVNTSGASAVYYSGFALSYQTTCFLPTTTALGSSTPETYYINILNTGTTDVGVQYSNNPQLN